MGTVELTGDTFESTIAGNDIVIIDWWASWCAPCRRFAPIFEDAARRNPDVVFAKVDTEANPELAAVARITSIPTVMVFREQVRVYSQPGALPARALDELIAKVRELDMDQVHRIVAERTAAAS